jgi:chromosome segregation ATPase
MNLEERCAAFHAEVVELRARVAALEQERDKQHEYHMLWKAKAQDAEADKTHADLRAERDEWLTLYQEQQDRAENAEFRIARLTAALRAGRQAAQRPLDQMGRPASWYAIEAAEWDWIMAALDAAGDRADGK